VADEVEQEARFHYEKRREAGRDPDSVRTWDDTGKGVRNYYRQKMREQLAQEGFEVASGPEPPLTPTDPNGSSPRDTAKR
jgi:hypothetical protein